MVEHNVLSFFKEAGFRCNINGILYMATAVISSEGMHYLHGIIPAIDITITTVIVLVALLFGFRYWRICICSSNNFYNSTLATSSMCQDGFFSPMAYTNFSYQLESSGHFRRYSQCFLRFFCAMLEFGFESSSNFVEEQEQGCFKTLRNNGPLSVLIQ
jgi:hypothetical protein